MLMQLWGHVHEAQEHGTSQPREKLVTKYVSALRRCLVGTLAGITSHQWNVGATAPGEPESLAIVVLEIINFLIFGILVCQDPLHNI